MLRSNLRPGTTGMFWIVLSVMAAVLLVTIITMLVAVPADGAPQAAATMRQASP